MTLRRPVLALASLALVAAIVPARGAVDGRLRGEVRTAERRPVAGATVLAVRGGSPPVLALTATDPNGALAIDGVPAGSYRLIVDAAGFDSQEIGELSVGGPFRSVVDLVMRPGTAPMAPVVLDSGDGPLRAVLRVQGEAGQPLGSVSVRLDPVGHRHDPIRALTDEQGAVALDGLGPGAWRVSISKAGWTRLHVPQLSWPAGELTLLARILPLTGVDAPFPEDLLPGPAFLPPAQPLPPPAATPEETEPSPVAGEAEPPPPTPTLEAEDTPPPPRQAPNAEEAVPPPAAGETEPAPAAAETEAAPAATPEATEAPEAEQTEPQGSASGSSAK